MTFTICYCELTECGTLDRLWESKVSRVQRIARAHAMTIYISSHYQITNSKMALNTRLLAVAVCLAFICVVAAKVEIVSPPLPRARQ
jgi:hypothetical protein